MSPDKSFCSYRVFMSQIRVFVFIEQKKIYDIKSIFWQFFRKYNIEIVYFWIFFIAARTLCRTTLNAGPILRDESLLWMQKISSRLGGRVAFRRPYYGSISRSIPYDVFKVARRVLSENRDGSFYEPRCYIKKNNRAEVLCFTSLYSLQKFLSTISALSIKEIKQYFCRQLKSRGREDHSVKLLVDEDKQMAFTYIIKRGQLNITFQYGEWNTARYPLHNCKFDPSTS